MATIALVTVLGAVLHAAAGGVIAIGVANARNDDQPSNQVQERHERAENDRIQARPRSAITTTTSNRAQTRPRAATTRRPNVIPAQPQPSATPTPNDGEEQILESVRECIICAEAYTDLDGFPPPRILPECSTRHSMDTCRICLSKHIGTRVRSQGASIWEQLSCPKPDCGHFYTHEQVRRRLSDPDTFALYDEYGLNSILAKRPSFRRCLRPGCKNGQSYEVVWGSDSSTSNSMECRECGFVMCFKHQCPWHEGSSCEEYDSRRRSSVQQTEAWLTENTKSCPGPGCGVRIEKANGCWHMTCRSCRFEFCWNCLGDWSKIRVDRKYHKPNCWFRHESSPLLTEVVGNTLQEAQRSRYYLPRYS